MTRTVSKGLWDITALVREAWVLVLLERLFGIETAATFSPIVCGFFVKFSQLFRV